MKQCDNYYDQLSDYCTQHTPQLGKHAVTIPNRPLEVSDLDDIFAGKPLAKRH